MRINTIAKSYQVSESLADFIAKKTNKLDRLLREDTEVQVKLLLQTQNTHCAELTIPLGDGTIVRVEEVGDDVRVCIDRAVDKVIRQIRKHRTKLSKRLRSGGLEAIDELPELTADEPTQKLVKTKRFTMKPMNVEDAIAQMEMLGHSFFLFIDDETNQTCVVYIRTDGDYGLLAPDNA